MTILVFLNGRICYNDADVKVRVRKQKKLFGKETLIL